MELGGLDGKIKSMTRGLEENLNWRRIIVEGAVFHILCIKRTSLFLQVTFYNRKPTLQSSDDRAKPERLQCQRGCVCE